MNTIRLGGIITLVLFLGGCGIVQQVLKPSHDVNSESLPSLMPNTAEWTKKYIDPVIPGGAMSNDYYEDPRPGKEGRWAVETFEIDVTGEAAEKTVFLRRWDIILEGGEYRTSEMYSALLVDGVWLYSEKGEEVDVEQKTIVTDTAVVLRFSFSLVTHPGKNRVLCFVYGDMQPGVPAAASDHQICGSSSAPNK